VVLVNLEDGERLAGKISMDHKWKLPNIAIVAKVIPKLGAREIVQSCSCDKCTAYQCNKTKSTNY
jgi:hypothetical protein